MKVKANYWGLLLLPISIILFVATAWIGFVFSIIYSFGFKDILRRIAEYFMAIAISIDQLGNVIMSDLFNVIFIQKGSVNRFGHEDETISSVLGKNKASNSLTALGAFLANVLDFIDPNHVLDSIEHQIKD